MDAAPFRALRYDPAIAGDPAATSAPAYDEVERFAYASHRTASPYTVLELLAPSGGQDFASAGAALARWRRTGVLRQDREPAFYLYEEHELRGGVPAVQRGVLAAVRLARPGSPGALQPHEQIDRDRVSTRLQRLQAAPLDVSPVFAVYDGGPPALRELLDRPPRRPPVAALTDEQGVDHRVWAITDPADLATIRAGLAGVTAVIADGHHRWATALAYRDLRRTASVAAAGGAAEEPWERTLAYVVDARAHGPRVEAIHRLVLGLPPDVTARLERVFALGAAPDDPARLLALARATEGPALGLLHAGRGWLLTPRAPAALEAYLPARRSASWRALDAAVFTYAVVRLLGDGVEVVPRSDMTAAAATAGAPDTALFLLRPPGVGTVLELAAGREPLPPKTTSFRPKPRTGLVMRAVAPLE